MPNSIVYILTFSLILFSCSSSNQEDFHEFEKGAAEGEYIHRKHDEYFYAIAPPKLKPLKTYSWDQRYTNNIPRINKDFFRCKGSLMNPDIILNLDGESKTIRDCEGIDAHGLPLKEGKEFIYPILIDLLNYIQDETNLPVIITSGHRCPAHNSYVDSSKANLYSKHMIGAEVSFYVKSMENSPLKIVDLIQKYYLTIDSNKDNAAYTLFKRFDHEKTNVRTDPWHNKEIFIKLFEKNEGRNFDNPHSFPYISIQIRHDRERNESVTYSWKKANREILRQ